MTERTKQGLATRALHAGWRSDPSTGAFGLPIYLTAAYQFRDSEHAVKLFELAEEGHIYSRLSNPTVGAYEAAVADLEGGVGALATSSGQAAFTHLLAALCSAGDHLVVSRKLYGGTLTLVKNTFARFGVTHTLVDTDDPSQVEAAVTPATRAILTETVGNPALNVAPLEDLGRIARARDVVLVVDNTFATPCLCRPFEWGAHVVVHSTTKFLSGQGNVIGGMVVDGGTMDWEASDRWPLLTQPDPSYHGVVFTKQFGPAALAAKLRATLLRDLGGTPSAFDSYLLRQSLGTLPLRMARHSDNALTVARHLEAHPQVEWVLYPGLDSHPQRDLAKRYLPEGCGGMVACAIRGGVEAGRRFLDALGLFGHMANLGDSRSLAIHPASTTHSQLTREERLAGGIEDGLIRLSIGLEDPRDLVEDLEQAFAAAR